jgi:hypothetical protein
MIRERWGAMDRRKTSLPPPGLEWVMSVTTLFLFDGVHAVAVVTASRTARIRVGRSTRGRVYDARFLKSAETDVAGFDGGSQPSPTIRVTWWK